MVIDETANGMEKAKLAVWAETLVAPTLRWLGNGPPDAVFTSEDYGGDAIHSWDMGSKHNRSR